MTDTEQRIADLEIIAKHIVSQLWRLQGRMNAMEMVATLAVFNIAQTQPNPFHWVQAYVETMRKSTRSLVPEVDDQSKAERLLVETRTALEEFLTQVVREAGQLKGSPGKT
jgi:hypothetical protein